MDHQGVRGHQGAAGRGHDGGEDGAEHQRADQGRDLIEQQHDEGAASGLGEFRAGPHAHIDHEHAEEDQGDAAEEVAPEGDLLGPGGADPLHRGLVHQHGEQHGPHEHHPEIRRQVEEAEHLRLIVAADGLEAAPENHAGKDQQRADDDDDHLEHRGGVGTPEPGEHGVHQHHRRGDDQAQDRVHAEGLEDGLGGHQLGAHGGGAGEGPDAAVEQDDEIAGIAPFEVVGQGDQLVAVDKAAHDQGVDHPGQAAGDGVPGAGHAQADGILGSADDHARADAGANGGADDEPDPGLAGGGEEVPGGAGVGPSPQADDDVDRHKEDE